MSRARTVIAAAVLLTSHTALVAQQGYAARAFSWKLFEVIARENPTDNVILSPTSVAFAVGMVRAGARGATLGDINRVMAFPANEPADADPWARRLMATLTGNRDLTIRIANSVWVHRSFPVSSKFLGRTRRDFSAEVRTLDLTTSEAVEAINQWANDNTEGMIKSIRQSPFPDGATAVLMNATYFKAAWRDKFDSAWTRPMPFHLANGQERPHPLMSVPCECTYLENDAFQLVRVPYRGDSVAMYVLLPRQGYRLKDIASVLGADSLHAWRARMTTPGRLRLLLPRFKAETTTNLQPPLVSLGLGRLFDENEADLGGMVEGVMPTPLVVTEAVQKAIVEVTEEGTEAAAITSITIGPASAEFGKTIIMQVDRPFFFVIQDDATETPLFVGRVMDPQP